MNGYIPLTLTFISRPSETIENTWDDGEVMNSFEAAPTFVATNAATRETGLSWAKGGYGRSGKVTETGASNTPFSHLRIVSHERRAEGGGAFKVIADNQWYVDLRTDVLLDILANTKVERGEVKGAQFIWARVGSHMKIVRVGSAIHTELIESDKVKAQVAIKQKDLKPGDVLQKANGEKEVFLGWVSTLDFEGADQGQYSFNGASTPTKYTLTSITHIPRIGVYWSYYAWSDKEWDGKTVRFGDNSQIDRRASVGKRFKVGSVEVPANWMEKAKKGYAELMQPAELAKEYYQSYRIKSAAAILSMTPVGEFPPLHPALDTWRETYNLLPKP